MTSNCLPHCQHKKPTMEIERKKRSLLVPSPPLRNHKNYLFFTIRVVKHRSRFPRELIDCPYVELLKTQPDTVLGNLLLLTLPTWAMLWFWDKQAQRVLSFLAFFVDKQWTRQMFVRCARISVSFLYPKCTTSRRDSVLIYTSGNPRQIIAGTASEATVCFSVKKD